MNFSIEARDHEKTGINFPKIMHLQAYTANIMVGTLMFFQVLLSILVSKFGRALAQC